MTGEAAASKDKGPVRAPWRIPLDSSKDSQASGNVSKAGQPPTAKPRLPGPPPARREKDEEDEGKGEAAEAAPRRKGRRGGRRTRRGDHSEKKWTSKDKQLLSLLKSTLKLVLQTARRTRLNSSLATDTYTCPKAHKVIDAASNELEGYKNHLGHLRQGTAEDKKKLKEIGSPAPSMGLAALEGVLSCDIGGALRTEIEDYLKQTNPPDANMDPEISRDELAEEISFIRLENCFYTEKMKLIIGAPVWGGRKLLMKAFRSEGAVTHHHGVAPAGWLEDEVGHWLETLDHE